jgi:hypothetical protein
MAIVDEDPDNRRRIAFGLRSVCDSDVEAEVFATFHEAERWLISELAGSSS